MSMHDNSVAVIGGGPVGLVFALSAHARGLRPLVVERRTSPRSESRAIGIHPPSLELLDRLGLADRFLARGILVRRGLAFGTRGIVGAISFHQLSGRHKYVLALPQQETETLLREALEERVPDALLRGRTVTGITQTAADVEIELTDVHGTVRHARATAAVACDGKHSATRGLCGVRYEGGPYDGAYAMGDFPDTTTLGDQGAVFLTPHGLVESFPLPGGYRRWVIRRQDACGLPTADEIATVVRERTGHVVCAADGLAVSGFRAEHWLASQFSIGRVAFAGDAAHVISPIGGQGMNVGWLGAEDLAETIADSLRRGTDLEAALARSAARRLRVVTAARRRSELNMWIGRPTARPERRERVVGLLLRGIAGHVFARSVTMRGLRFGV